MKPLLSALGDLRGVDVEDERDRRVEPLVSRITDLGEVTAVRWRR